MLANPTLVIARESGRSSIPETAVIQSRRLGVLNRPVKPGDDGRWMAIRLAPYVFNLAIATPSRAN